METRALRRTPAAASLVLCLLCGCAGPTGVDGPDEEPPVPDEALTMTVDAVDLSHGALRFFGTMDDGSADVTVQLGGDCEHREVGGGFATATGFVWSLSDADLTDAIPCNLRVRARTREGTHIVHRVADLTVALDMVAVDTDRGPQLRDIGVEGDTIHIGVASGAIEVGDDANVDRFVIPLGEFARTIVLGRRPRLDGAEFYAWASIGAVAMEVQPVAPEPPADEAQEAEDPDGEDSSGESTVEVGAIEAVD
jgi:hypothetical protein